MSDHGYCVTNEQMLDREDYYLVNDPDLCTSTLKYGIHFLKHNWSWMSGRPTIVTIIHRYHLGLH